MYLEARLALVNRPVHDIRVQFYRLTQDKIAARLVREGSIGTSHSAGACGFCLSISEPTLIGLQTV